MSIAGVFTFVLILVLGTLTSATSILSGQVATFGNPAYSVLPIKIVADETLAPTWKVLQAQLRESVASTWGVLRIQNVSTYSAQQMRILAEYYDREGRQCFTLVFSEQASVDKISEDGRPIRPGEVRALLSHGFSFAPTSAPVEVRVYLVGHKLEGKPAAVVRARVPVRVPLTMLGDVVSVTLDLDASQRSQAMVDLILARIECDDDGIATRVEVLNALNDDLKAWFLQFATSRSRYVPAALNFSNVPGSGLFLLRAVNRIVGVAPEELLPRKSSWLQSYMATVRGNLPGVTHFLFERSSEIIPFGPGAEERLRARTKDPTVFELITAGSDWSATVVRRVVDPRSNRTRPQWNPPE